MASTSILFPPAPPLWGSGGTRLPSGVMRKSRAANTINPSCSESKASERAPISGGETMLPAYVQTATREMAVPGCTFGRCPAEEKTVGISVLRPRPVTQQPKQATKRLVGSGSVEGARAMMHTPPHARRPAHLNMVRRPTSCRRASQQKRPSAIELIKHVKPIE